MKTTYRGFYTLRWYDSETHELKRKKTFQNTITAQGRAELVSRGALPLGTILLLWQKNVVERGDPIVMGAGGHGYDAPQAPQYIFRKRKRARFDKRDARGESVTGKLYDGLAIAWERASDPSEEKCLEKAFSIRRLLPEEKFSIASNEILDVIYTIEVIPDLGTATGAYTGGGTYTARRAYIGTTPSVTDGVDVALPSIGTFQCFETQTLGDITSRPSGVAYNAHLEDKTVERTTSRSTTAMTISFTSGNTPSGLIGSVLTNSLNWHIQYQLSFNPPLQKTEENKLRISFDCYFEI